MVSSISSTETESVQLMMAQMFQSMNAADTDGRVGLSKAELSSIGSSVDSGGSAFLSSLSEQFDSLDADGNGQLSAKEIASVKPPKDGPMGPPPGLEITDSIKELASSTDSVASTSSTTTSNSVGDTLETLMQQLLNSFVDGFEKTDSDGSGTSSKELASVTSVADVDGSSSLSLDEITSAVTTESTAQAGFIKDLADNFKIYDKDSDGQLSQFELKDALEKGGPQQRQASTMSNSLNEVASNLGSISGSFVQKLINSYKNGDLSSVASSLSFAG